MRETIRVIRNLALAFLFTFIPLGLMSQAAVAGIVGTDTVMAEDVSAERERIAGLLEREDVRDRLIAYGVSPEEARERVAGMRDEEVMELAERIDALPAGGSRLLIVLLLVIVIILLI